jgi:hypothetical protein
MTNNSSKVVCQYCQRSFTKEKTLASHTCEPKRRAQQEKEVGVQIGFQAYLKFYELTQGSTANKTYKDFAKSAYYTAFVKYGRHMVAVRALDAASYTVWLLKNNKKLDYWCSDKFYTEWLIQYLRRENSSDALVRAVETMQEYADATEGMVGLNDYFRFGNPNRICHHISSGRISPWALYNCETGRKFLERLPGDLLEMIYPYIDPEYWNKHIHDLPEETTWAQQVLKTAGL